MPPDGYPFSIGTCLAIGNRRHSVWFRPKRYGVVRHWQRSLNVNLWRFAKWPKIRKAQFPKRHKSVENILLWKKNRSSSIGQTRVKTEWGSQKWFAVSLLHSLELQPRMKWVFGRITEIRVCPFLHMISEHKRRAIARNHWRTQKHNLYSPLPLFFTHIHQESRGDLLESRSFRCHIIIICLLWFPDSRCCWWCFSAWPKASLASSWYPKAAGKKNRHEEPQNDTKHALADTDLSAVLGRTFWMFPVRTDFKRRKTVS